MPKECLDCRFVTVDDTAISCDRCGGERLRFSVLAGLKFREQKAEAVRAKLGQGDRPTLFDRGKQVLLYLAASQFAAFVLLGAAIFATSDDEVPKTTSLTKVLGTVADVYPAINAIGTILIPAAAAGAGVFFALRGVYLAQQVGLFVGPVSALVTLAGYEAVSEGGAPFLAWLLAPPFAAGLAFIAGLRMTGYVRAVEDEPKSIEYKPVDSWDRDAKAKFVALRAARRGHLKKLSWGIGAGGLTTHLLPFLLRTMSGGSAKELATAHVAFGWLGVVVAGGFAAAGTTAPVLQGGLAGALMYFVRHYAHLSFSSGALLQLWVHAAAGIAGGLLGRLFFPPPRVVRGRVRCASDGVVYVGDELARNSA